jgi:signal peptidase I
LEQAASTSERSRWPGRLAEVATTLVLTIVFFWIIQTFLAQPFRVEQESMSGTLEEGDYVLVDKLTPRFDTHSHGDIVVFQRVEHEAGCASPGTRADDVPFIKRVLGVPGDVVVVSDGTVSVNGAVLDEPYIHGQSTTGNDSWTIGPGELFVMGDNRGESSDSRVFGPICDSDVVGRAVLRYWPLNAIGILLTPMYTNVPHVEATLPTSSVPRLELATP